MIVYKQGNLFDSNVDALVQGCNTQGIMSAGIAVEFKKRFPDMYESYRQLCNNEMFILGSGQFYENPTTPHVINLATQESGGAHIRYIKHSLKWIDEKHKEWGIESIAMPRIGCGLGGLDWEIVQSIIERRLGNSELRVEVWTLPGL